MSLYSSPPLPSVTLMPNAWTKQLLTHHQYLAHHHRNPATHPKPKNPNPTPSLINKSSSPTIQVLVPLSNHSVLRLNKTQLASPFPNTSYHTLLPPTAVHRTTQYSHFRVIPEYPLPFQKVHPTKSCTPFTVFHSPRP